jgi:ectoine hydroxylase-related dioxygenase (phytanoyl-CoA dioxygenase family)
MLTELPEVRREERQAFYAENGFLFVPGLLSRAEAGELRREGHAIISRLAQHHRVEATWGSARAVAGAAETELQHCHNVEYHSALFTRLIVDHRLTAIAAELIGGPNVQLHHTKLFIKPPEKGSPFPMHQDHPFFPHERHSMIAAIVHLDDAPLEKGCLRVVPGSHRHGPLAHDPQGGWHLPFDRYPLDSAVVCPAEAGDVLFFSYLTVHGSGVNTSSEARTTVLIQMRDAADRQLEGGREVGDGLMLRGSLPAGAEGSVPVQVRS